MLIHMGVKNFALIEQLTIDFSDGITIFTGETGAGKSILMNAFSILLGERASQEFIRTGADSFLIHGVFDINDQQELQAFLTEKNIPLDNTELILSRTFNRQGKSTILANDVPITLKTLKEMGSYLADIHGQFSNQDLLNPQTHHIYLDTYTPASKEAFESYVSAYHAYKVAADQLAMSIEKEAERARELDMLRFQIDDIESAALVPGEDEELSNEIRKFDQFESLSQSLSQCYEAFYEGDAAILDRVQTIQSEVHKMTHVDSDLQTAYDLLSSACAELEEVANVLDTYKDTLAFDEERYQYCQDRDSLIYELKRKYGQSIEEILQFEMQAQHRLEELEEQVQQTSGLSQRIELLKEQAEQALQTLTNHRQKNAKSLSQLLQQQIKKLGMKNATLTFSIEGAPTLNALGATHIELLFSANTGEALLPLHKVASGGELSRIALAFKSVFHGISKKTLVFDEIDVGISGDVALQVAHQIQDLSASTQVFCITHLPQTASIAKQHYHIKKEEIDGRTMSTIISLDDKEHIAQIANMMSGESFSNTAIETAKEMIQYFKKNKQKTV